MRGRLIVPFYAKIYRLDTVATDAAGYDPVFREPIKQAGGASTRVEHAAVFVPCQPEPSVWEALNQTGGGNDANSDVILTFHFRDLENLGLVDGTSGEALLRVNDRLESLHEYPSQDLIQLCGPTGFGFFCIEAQPQSFGLSGGKRNLLLCRYRGRDQSYEG